MSFWLQDVTFTFLFSNLENLLFAPLCCILQMSKSENCRCFPGTGGQESRVLLGMVVMTKKTANYLVNGPCTQKEPSASL